MRKIMTLLGVFMVGEGLVLALLPENYIDFWAKIISFTIPQGSISRREYAAARLLGVAELLFGVLWVRRSLATPVEIAAEGEK